MLGDDDQMWMDGTKHDTLETHETYEDPIPISASEGTKVSTCFGWCLTVKVVLLLISSIPFPQDVIGMNTSGTLGDGITQVNLFVLLATGIVVNILALNNLILCFSMIFSRYHRGHRYCRLSGAPILNLIRKILFT